MKSASKSHPIELGRQYLLFGLVLRIRLGSGAYKIKFLWRRIFLLLATLCLLAWLAVAALLYTFFKYKRDFSEVAYSDMLLLPIRMADHRNKMGHYHLKKGLDFFEQGEFGDCFRLLRLGLINAPEHIEGRIIVANFYRVTLRRPEVAIDVALKGLDHGGLENADFLKFLFFLMAAEKRDQQICELVDQYLPEEVEDIHIQKIMAYHAAKAYYERGHYDEAEQLINDYKLIDTQGHVGLKLFYQVQWARGEKQQTINDLEAIFNRSPHSTKIIGFLVSLHLEEGNYDRVRQIIALQSLSAPSNFEPKLDLLQLAVMEEDSGEVEDQFDRLSQNYGVNEEARMRLAEFAAQFGLIDKSKDMYLQADAAASNKEKLAILLLRSYMKSGAYRQGIEFASTLSNVAERLQIDKESYVSYGYYALNEDALAELHLKSFLRIEKKSSSDYLNLARDLITIGRQKIALDLLHKALELDSANQAVIVEALKLELELADLPSIKIRLDAYLKTRRPDKALLQTCYEKLVGDRFMFERDRASLLRKLRADL